MKKTFYIVLIFFSCSIAVGQTPAYKHYDVNNGLPTNEVYEIKQDRQGFLWIGCDAGLVRYNGNSFRLLSNKKNRGPAISGLREDQNSRIWCINFSGQIFYTEGDSLHLFEPWEKNYKSNFADIAIDQNNYLYVTNFANNIYSYNLSNNEEKIIVNNEGTKVFIYTAYDGNLLFTFLDSGQVKKLIPGGIVTVPKVYGDGRSFPVPTINNFVFYNSYRNLQTLGFQRFNQGDRKPSLFYYWQEKLYLHPVSAFLQELNAFPTCCLDDDDGNLFVGTMNELLWFKKSADGQWLLFNRLLQGNGISFIQQDREGDLWISTLKNGIYKIPNKQIWSIPQNLLNTKSGSINHIATDGKAIVFGATTSGEVFGFNVNSNKYFQVNTPEKRDVQALDYDFFTRQLFISKIGTTVYSLDQGRIIKNWSFEANNAKDYYFRRDGVVFITGSGANAFYNKNSIVAKNSLSSEFVQQFNNYSEPDHNSLQERFIISEQRCKGIWYQEKTKTLWVGFVDGLTYFENKVPFKFKDPSTNLPVIAIGFDEGPDGTLYIATVEQGVYVVKDKKIINHYSTATGLLSDRVKRIRLANNYLWVIGGGALQAVNLKTGLLKTVNTADGLLSSEVFDVEVLNHTVYVATASGIQYFPENIETKNKVYPVCLLAGIEADGSKFVLNEKTGLPYDTKNISFTLDGIALKSDGKFIFQYRLLPADTNWISVSANENIIRFSSLAPGNYTFQCRVVNEDGVMSEKNVQQKFSIQKPWWLQWWFLLLCLLFSMILIYWIFQKRIKASQHKNLEQLEKSRIQEQLRSSQLSSLKAQMNPHFMFNALNSIQEFILLNDKRQANMYMGKFADLMRMTLDMSNKEEVSLDEEIKVLDLYLQLEALRFEEHFEYKIIVDPLLDTHIIYIPSMLIQPYVENAVKHGLLHRQGEKTLTIRFSKTDDRNLGCAITDNGIGRKRSVEINEMRQKKYTSFATGATQKRLDLLNHSRAEAISVRYDDLHDSNGNASGTSVRLNIPI